MLVGYKIGSTQITDSEVIKVSGSDIHPILQYTGNLGDIVKGTAFELSEAELIKADSYEVEQYKRVLATLKSGEIVWIYVES